MITDLIVDDCGDRKKLFLSLSAELIFRSKLDGGNVLFIYKC